MQVGNEEISYTGISSNELTGVTREVRNSTKLQHIVLVLRLLTTSDYVAWGEAAW